MWSIATWRENIVNLFIYQTWNYFYYFFILMVQILTGFPKTKCEEGITSFSVEKETPTLTTAGDDRSAVDTVIIAPV